jgi:UDPglucose--hexose-1-phosphate uridylyltransferase
VPNKYPALVPGEKDLHRYRQGIYLAMPRYGKHEVIIETPQHNRDLALMDERELQTVIETYHRRYVNLMREHDNMIAIIFRNHGRRAGTSLLHPHSQIIVAGMAPRYIRFQEEAAQEYYDELGRCVYCDILKYEMDDQERVIFENELFLAFLPFAADVPFEIWIIPKIHRADFGSLSDAEKDMLTAILGESLSRLHDRLNDPDYNYVINTAAQYKADEPQLHWYLQIQPRLTTRAGFEIGSGVRINPSIPEEDAAYLKQPLEEES